MSEGGRLLKSIDQGCEFRGWHRPRAHFPRSGARGRKKMLELTRQLLMGLSLETRLTKYRRRRALRSRLAKGIFQAAGER